MNEKLGFDIVINDADKLMKVAEQFPELVGKNLTKQIKEALKALKDAREGTPEQQQQAKQQFDPLVKLVTDALIDGLQGGAKEFSDTIKQSIADLVKLEEKRAAQVTKVGGLKQSFQLNEEGTEFVDLRSREKEKEILQEQLRLYKEQKIAAGELTEEQAKLIPTSHTLLKDQDRMIAVVKDLNLKNEEKEEIIEKIRAGNLEEIDQLEDIIAKMKSKFTVEEHTKRQRHVMNAQLSQQQVKTNAIKAANDELLKLNNQNLDIDKKRKEIADSLADAEVTTMTQEIDPEVQKQNIKITNALNATVGDGTQTLSEFNKEQERLNRSLKANSGTFAKAANQVFNYGLAFTFLRRIYRETLRTIRDLDKALTEMAIVTTMNRNEAWQLTDQMSALARETGFTISEISKLSTVYFRQGRVLSEVIELTRVAAMAARIAGISAAESADFLTSAVNAFQFSADQALAVSDRFAALAAQSASSYEELAVGLSKFAAQANVAGVSIDFAMGLLAKGIETTREAPETIGTALKTVIARMRELTDLGKTFEDGMDISRVETALRQVGVTLRDQQGQFRDLELVLTEIGQGWNTLTTNQRASVAVALAGTRQQSRLIAIMQDFDRTLELVNVSQESAGATAAQHVQFMQGLEGATIRMQAAYQDFITTISDSDMLINIVNMLTRTIDNLSSGLKSINDNSRFWMTSLIALFLGLRTLTAGTKIYNAAISRKIKLQKMEEKGMKLNWWNTRRLTAAKKLESLEIDLQNARRRRSITLQNLDTAARSKNIAMVKLQILWYKALNVVLAFSPVLLLVAGFVLFTAVLGRSANAIERNTKALEENRKELQASMFERRRTVRSIQQVIDKMEEFNDLPFLTPQQKDELETLNEQLRELFGQDAERFMATREIDGSLNLVSQQLLSQQFISEQLNKQAQDRIDLTNNLIESQRKATEEFKDFESEVRSLIKRLIPFEFTIDSIAQSIGSWAAGLFGIESLTEFVPEFSPANLQALGDVFVAELNLMFQESFDRDISPETEDAFRRFLANFDLSGLEDEDFDLVEYVQENFLDAIELLEEFGELMDPESTLAQRVQNFNKFFETERDEDLSDVIKRYMAPGIEFLSDQGLDFVNALEHLGITSDQQIQQLGSVFGKDFPEIIDLVQAETDRLQRVEGIPAVQAQEIAWSSLVGTIEDTTEAIRVYNAIFVGSFSDMANSLAQLDSQMERTRDIQSQWLEGTVSPQELAQFFADNEELFATQEDIDRFLGGEDLTDSILLERLNEERMAISRLFDAERRLAELAPDDERRGAILSEIAAYRALTENRGPLTQMSQAQFEYNAELERYNRLSEIGAETTEDFQRVLEVQARVFTETAQRVDDNLAAIQRRFSESASEFGFATTEFSDFFEVIGGQVVPITEELNGLYGSSLTFINNLFDDYQESLDEAFEAFEERRKFELDNEKKLLDKQKKVYEDYFAALDRLEQRRDRSRSRDDMVAQLARLEGATDERSRRRALEIRRELNRLDEDDSRNMIQEARQALLQTFDTAYEELEATWARMTKEFMDILDGGGGANSAGNVMGTDFSEKVNEDVDLDLEVEVGVTGLNASITNFQTAAGGFVDRLEAIFDREPEVDPREQALAARQARLNARGTTGRTGTTTRDRGMADPVALARAEFEGWVKSNTRKPLIGPPVPPAYWQQNQKREELLEKYNIDSFKKGGMVDFEGLAMLHGSKSGPEAVLSASQTEMFIGLRDTLEGLSFDNSNSGSVNIENISISTASLNNNQDFKRAGESLADAFKHAIQRKGVTINTNRT